MDTRLKYGIKIRKIFSIFKKITPMVFKISPYYFTLYCLLFIIQSCFPIIQLYLTKELINSINIISNIEHSRSTAYSLILFQGLLLVLSLGINLLKNLISINIKNKLSYHCEKLICDKTNRIPLIYIENPDFFNMQQRASSGIGQRGFTVVSNFLLSIQHILSLTGLLIVIAQFHWLLAFTAFGVVIPSFFANIKVSEKKYATIKENTVLARKVNYLYNTLTSREHAKELKLFGHYNFLKEKWSNFFWSNAKVRYLFERSAAIITFIYQSLGNIITVVTSGVLVWFVYKGILNVGEFIAITQAFTSSQNSLNQVLLNISKIYEDSIFMKDLFDFLELPEEPHLYTGKHITKLEKGITVRNLSFSYGSLQTLNGISFSIKAGEKIAIVGENGAGKSSLIKCLLGFYQIDEGEIYFDKININDINKSALRNLFAVVFQDFNRYFLTVRENVAFGNIEKIYDDASLYIAAGRAGIQKDVEKLIKGFDTELGRLFSSGHELSGGQWQKIALSRAFLRDAEILVLDEPTASLDPIAEANIFERFMDLADGKTAIFISHRLGSCKKADRILVLKNGEIVEAGTHDQLMSMNGEYNRMFTSQAKWYS